MLATTKLSRKHSPFSFWLQWFLLLACLIAAVFLASLEVSGTFAKQHKLVGLVLLGLVLLIYPKLGAFTRLRSVGMRFTVTSLGWCAVVLTAWGLFRFLELDLTNHSERYFQLLLIYGWLAQVVSLSATHLIFANRICRGMGTRVLIVGSGRLAERINWGLSRNSFLPDRVLGYVADAHDRDRWVSAQYLGPTDQLAQIIERDGVEKIYIALPLAESAQVERIFHLAACMNIDVIWAPDIFSLDLINPGVRELAGVPLLSVSEGPLTHIGTAYVKSLLDVLVAAVALTALAPLMLAIALLVRVTSAGPVFYRQERHGWDGTVFEIWKFRTMQVHVEGGGKVTQAKKNDKRLTPVGRFLRRSSIDELPQLFNVLNGTMSMVGPRPHATAHNYEYADKIASYMMRHRIKPGITGWAQVNGWRGETDTLEKMARRVTLDLEYINKWSPWFDLWILFRTPAALFSKSGAY